MGGWAGHKPWALPMSWAGGRVWRCVGRKGLQNYAGPVSPFRPLLPLPFWCQPQLQAVVAQECGQWLKDAVMSGAAAVENQGCWWRSPYFCHQKQEVFFLLEMASAAKNWGNITKNGSSKLQLLLLCAAHAGASRARALHKDTGTGGRKGNCPGHSPGQFCFCNVDMCQAALICHVPLYD